MIILTVVDNHCSQQEMLIDNSIILLIEQVQHLSITIHLRAPLVPQTFSHLTQISLC